MTSGDAKADRLDIVAAVLLAAAAVATAWSSYQASRWSGEQAEAFSAANAARVESSRSSDLANAQTQVDIEMFSQWVDAHLDGDRELAAFYEDRFRDELDPAFRAWLATDPFDTVGAPPSPFAMPEYRLVADRQAAKLEADAERFSAEARQDVQRATNYVLGVVSFAVVLFFAGIGSKLSAPTLRRFVVGAGVAVFAVTVVWIATFPVSVSI